MKEKKKLGFPTPIRVWLKSYLGKYVREIISNANVDKLINKEYVINLLDEHIEGKRDNSRKVWTVFMFCLWYRIKSPIPFFCLQIVRYVSFSRL